MFVGATPISGGQHLPAGNPAQGLLQEGGAGAGAHQQVPQGELLSQGRRGQEAFRPQRSGLPDGLGHYSRSFIFMYSTKSCLDLG